ncbi:unnamed protein product [Dovyalis caffra]|uniref:SHSP domain-containing protein n=1 Tax=Dovyalis caffra TaxID=77055 RepID=A0AAV1S603_9ROSI|nr:unnamed protein product [Dovyalis caffra]
MEDGEMAAVQQDLLGDSDANKPIDAAVKEEAVKEEEETADASEDQKPNENGQISVADDDKTVTLASDVPMTDTPALPDEKTAADQNTNQQVAEEKTDGDDGSHVQNQPQTATPSTPRRYSSPRTKHDNAAKPKNIWTDIKMGEADVAGTPEERAAFMKELETFYKQNSLDFKPPKFYGEPLNCLKTCTTVSWTFRIFYEKALLEYEKNKRETGELQLPSSPLLLATTVEKEMIESVTLDENGDDNSWRIAECEICVHQFMDASVKARRDAAARAMQGWHAQRHLGHGEVSEPIVKVKSLNFARREKPLKSIGLHKQKTDERPTNAETDKEVDAEIIDIGPPADWVKINVRESKDCYEIYALVPGLLREEVRVQSDPVGRLVITGQPEQLDNPWGITPFKKVVSLPSRIDPLQTSAVVSLHGRLHIRVPFEHGSA